MNADVHLEPVEGLFTVVEGRTLRLEVPTVAGTSAVDFEINGAIAREVTGPPYEYLFTVPAGVRDLAFRAYVRGDGDAIAWSRLTHLPVVPDAGIPLEMPPTRLGERVTLLAGGLRAEYFDFPLGLKERPKLASLVPARTGYVTAVNQPNPYWVFGFDPLGAESSAAMPQSLAFRYSGRVWVETAGPHQFWLSARSGASLAIDGNELGATPIGTNAVADAEMEVVLTRGWHEIAVEYFLVSGPESLELDWRQPNGQREVVPPEALSTAISTPIPAKFDTVWMRVQGGTGVIETSLVGSPHDLIQARERQHR